MQNHIDIGPPHIPCLFIGVFGIFMFPTLTIATIVYIASIIFAPCVDIDGIREPVAGSLLYGNNIISTAVIPSSNAIGVHFYPLWEASNFLDWFYNGGELNEEHMEIHH